MERGKNEKYQIDNFLRQYSYILPNCKNRSELEITDKKSE